MFGFTLGTLGIWYNMLSSTLADSPELSFWSNGFAIACSLIIALKAWLMLLTGDIIFFDGKHVQAGINRLKALFGK